jgi:hypothetical protein
MKKFNVLKFKLMNLEMGRVRKFQRVSKCAEGSCEHKESRDDLETNRYSQRKKCSLVLFEVFFLKKVSDFSENE